jgi:hypothetical protein
MAMGEIQVQVVMVHGSADPMTEVYARRKIGRLARFAPMPVLGARVRLELAPNPSLERPALARGMLDLNGRPLHAQVAARRLEEAVDLLDARLRHRLEHVAGQLRARRDHPRHRGSAARL